MPYSYAKGVGWASSAETNVEVNPINYFGVVIDRKDPLKLDRVRVRILGLHSERETDIPSDDLPWASVNTVLRFDLREGDWVTLTFVDNSGIGKGYFYPVVTGVIPGIQVTGLSGYGAEGFSPTYKPDIKSPPPGIVIRSAGDPTLPRQQRGVIQGTAIYSANQKRAHVCDISLEMRRAAAFIRIKFGTVIEKLRELINAILDALGFSPDGVFARILEAAKWFVRKLKQLRDFIQEIRDYTTVFVEYAKWAANMIAWILSLPQKALAFLKDCLSSIISSFATFGQELLSVSGGTVGGQISELMGQVSQGFQTASETVRLAAEAASNVVAIPAILLSGNAEEADVSVINSIVNGLPGASTANSTATSISTSINNFALA